MHDTTISPEAWRLARDTVRRALASSLCCAMASVGPDGEAHLAPVGSLWLHPTEPRGFYFEKFVSRLPRDLDHHPLFSILAVDSRRGFWGLSLLRGRFARPPAVRLVARAGEARPATEAEVAIFRRRVRFARLTRGYDIMSRDFSLVRDVQVEAIEPLNLAAMGKGLWPT